MLRVFIVTTMLILIGVFAASAQDIEYSGYLDHDEPEENYEIALEEGQSVVLIADATSGDLDTVLVLFDPDGEEIFYNDDRNIDTLNSALGFTVEESGIYTVTISRFPFSNTEGDYELEILVGDLSVYAALEELIAYEISGDDQVSITTPHFMVHYTRDGSDRTSDEFAQAIASTLEEVWQIQIVEMNWPAPPSDSLTGGDGLYDVYIADMINTRFAALGRTVPRVRIGDNPGSAIEEQRSGTSYFVIENDFDEDNSSDPITLMRSTVAHEFHHAVQLGYDIRDFHSWYYEATAVYMEIATLSKELSGTAFVGYNFNYPELCFGTEVMDPAVGLLRYGDWLFIQSLVDLYGEDIVQRLWENIAVHDGFDALEETLADYDDNVPAALGRYRVQNLVRDYELGDTFNATVWLEDIIDDTGRWSSSGRGVQELSANYYELDLRDGVYSIELSRDARDLEMWFVGVENDNAIAIPLGTGGDVEIEDYDYAYLMVFNSDYDDLINDCRYEDYSIRVERDNGEPLTDGLQWDASFFEPLSLRR